MKTIEQSEVCQAMATFKKNQSGKTFGAIMDALFRTPLLFPQGKGDKSGQLLMAQKDDQRMILAFTDMEEAEKGNLMDVDFVAYTIEEYAEIIAKTDVQGILINMFTDSNCIISKELFVNVVVPAFHENRIMPGLKSLKTGEYIHVTKMPFSIGRNPEADLVIDEETINEYHGLLIERDGKFMVVDRNSVNGIYVNGKKVDKEQELSFDDVIEFYEEEYSFVPMGIADRKAVGSSVYGNDLPMIANALFFMQNNVLVKEYLEDPKDFLEEMESEDSKEVYRKYFLISLETICKIREKELKIDNQDEIEDQRNAMLGRSVAIFADQDYGFTKIEKDGYLIYQVDFPEKLSVPGLAKRMYLMQQADGNRAVYAVRRMEEKTLLVKVSMDKKECNLGEAPETPEQELEKVLEQGV